MFALRVCHQSSEYQGNDVSAHARRHGIWALGLYEIGHQIFVFLNSFALRARRLRRAGGPGAEKNQWDRNCINDDH